jgi:eukaryotic-like serine/threonine-protein kinase
VTELEDELDERAQRARSARESLIGKTIAGRYILRGLVGHGGMGAVYEAEHVGLGKRAAIKFVDPEFATDENVVARFAREARAMSAIESAHIVTVFDAGSEDGRPYLVMELLRGEDLGQRLRRMGRVPLNEAMHIIAQVLKGLARAHGAGIIHRDLKPDNVFLVKHDTDPLFAKIVDFGISKIERPRANTHPLALTGRGTVLGTPFYMSPEQAQASSDVDGRTDLYSVGAILFECLTGRPPHTGESYEQVILSICMRDAPAVRSIDQSVSPEVSAFVERALARDRNQRFASAERMLAALHQVAPEERTRVPLDEPGPETLLSPGVSAFGATMLDGGGHGSRPTAPDEISATTRLGVGTLVSPAGETAEPVSAVVPMPAQANPKPQVPVPVAAAVAAGKDPKREREDERNRRIRPELKSDPGRASGSTAGKRPAKRPIGVALITAAIATLAGVGATFTIISMLDKKSTVGAGASASASAGPSAGARPSAMPSAVTIASGGVATGSADASANAASSAPATPSVSTASAKPGTPSSARPTTSATAVPPSTRPTSTKPLDIQRDLP